MHKPADTSPRQCIACGAQFSAYLPFPRYWLERYALHGYNLEGLEDECMNLDEHSCPVCGCNDRERLQIIHLATLPQWQKSRPLSILHIAPSANVTSYVSSHLPAWRHVTLDKFRFDVSLRCDVTDMSEVADETFDFILCSHVLEHIADDGKALRELHRVLKADGRAIILVPILVGRTETDEDPAAGESERWRRFGLNEHLRLYARGDLIRRLGAAGFSVELHGSQDYPEELVSQNAIAPFAMLYSAGKQPTSTSVAADKHFPAPSGTPAALNPAYGFANQHYLAGLAAYHGGHPEVAATEFVAFLKSAAQSAFDAECVAHLIDLSMADTNLDQALTVRVNDCVPRPDNMVAEFSVLSAYRKSDWDKLVSYVSGLGFRPAYANLDYYLGLAHVQRGDTSAAVEALLAAVGRASDLDQARGVAFELGRLAATPKECEAAILEALERSPFSADGRLLAHIDFLRGNNQNRRVIEKCRELAQIMTLPKVHLQAAIAHKKLGEYQEALELLKQEESVFGESPDINVQYSHIYRMLHADAEPRTQEELISLAMDRITRGLELSTTCLWQNLEMGRLYDLTGDYEKSLAYFNEEAKLQPSTPMVKDCIAQIRGKLS